VHLDYGLKRVNVGICCRVSRAVCKSVSSSVWSCTKASFDLIRLCLDQIFFHISHCSSLACSDDRKKQKGSRSVALAGRRLLWPHAWAWLHGERIGLAVCMVECNALARYWWHHELK
jgi:hypothetical protein